jgi:hypothetical protein
MSPAELARLRREREKLAAEQPDLSDRERLRKQARQEPTLSGSLRQAIHDSGLSLEAVADQAGVAPLLLDEFLTAERTLTSDALDRLARVLGCSLVIKD